MDIILLINQTSLDMNTLEQQLKADNSMEIIVNYIIQNIFPNALIRDQIDTDNNEPLDLNEVRETSINEGIELVKKLSLIIQKYITGKSGEYVNIDTSMQWFTGDASLIAIPECPNIFKNKKKISAILAIICKLVDFINTIFLTDIDLLNRKLSYVTAQPTSMHKIYLVGHLTKYHAECVAKFKAFHGHCYIIHDYILSIYRTNNHGYLGYMPQSTLNIFSSSLYFLKDDINFLNFIIDFVDWLPSEVRCKYFTKMILLKDKSLIMRFNPKVSLLIDDLNTLYKVYLKNPSIIEDLVIITQIINYIFQNRKIDLTIEQNILIYFVSVQLTIISKIKSIKIDIPIDEYYHIIIDCFQCILKVINNDHNILNSYLIYYIINISLDFYEDDNIILKSILDDLYFHLLQHKLTIIYLCSIKEEEYLLNMKIFLNMQQKDNIKLWIKIYSKIKESEFYDEFIDQITSCVIVKPCFIPMNADGTMIQVCDEYMISSYLWTTPVNPFTRTSLSISELMEFNKSTCCIEEKQIFVRKLKSSIDIAKT